MQFSWISIFFLTTFGYLTLFFLFFTMFIYFIAVVLFFLSPVSGASLSLSVLFATRFFWPLLPPDFVFTSPNHMFYPILLSFHLFLSCAYFCYVNLFYLFLILTPTVLYAIQAWFFCCADLRFYTVKFNQFSFLGVFCFSF